MLRSREFHKKSIYVFALHVAVLLLAAAWLPGTRQAYPAVFHTQANFILNLFGGERIVRLSEPLRSRVSDTKMAGYQRGRFEPRFTARYNIAERGYWPLVIVAAMVIATPLPLLQRALALTIGVFLINAFTLMQVASLAFVSFRLADAGGESEVWRRASTAATGIFNSELPRVVAVLLMWAIVARPAKTIDTSSARAWFRRLVRQRESSAAASKDERSP